ncbi:A24 family peptidase [Natronomonas marina]|jgi:preflagellin peptidase FlaK|uniref:A24 family peptidase n=1 Tax=Natronomonas marina TaxID=2961939 RepID=UPI0020C94EBB|nr:A24 family peptidase [Natronomonas marina]
MEVDARTAVSLVFGIASGPDLLRLVAVPVLGWAALRDVRTRRVPNRAWLPLVVVGVVALAWDALLVAGTRRQTLFVIRVLLSLGLVAPLGYVFWRLGGFGGADAKAVMTLAVVFPANPAYYLPASVVTALGGAVPAAYPTQTAALGVFSLTILSNTVLLGLAYPLLLALRNLPRGEITPAMFVGRPVAVDEIPGEYGRLLETPAGFTRRGLDVDALRMYLRWRGVDLAAVRSEPDRYRHPLPTERNDPGDGSIVDDERALTDGGETVVDTVDAPGPATDARDAQESAVRPLDTWGAARFLEEHRAYGTTPAELREGLEVLVESDRETVWLTPGIPFILPMFAGLVVALGYGDLLFALLSALGLA